LSRGSYTFNGTVTGTGTAFLQGTLQAPLVLTLGAIGNLGSIVKIGSYATLTLGATTSLPSGVDITVDGGTLVFSGTTFAAAANSTAKLTINTGQVDLNGYSQKLGFLALNGGTLLSTGTTFATITADTVTGGTTSNSSAVSTGTTYANNAGYVEGSKVEFVDGDPAQGIRLLSGALKNLASGTLLGGTLTTVGGIKDTSVSGTFNTVQTQGTGSRQHTHL
jgi:hypothetical protein